MRKTLQEMQERMRQRLNSPAVSSEPIIPDRPRCIACKKRYARKNSNICSRCNQQAVINNYRDVLPGMPVPSQQVIVKEISHSEIIKPDEDLLMCEIDAIKQKLACSEKQNKEISFDLQGDLSGLLSDDPNENP